VTITKLRKVIKKFKPKIIVHFAAESHVDNSIKSPRKFVQTNILGTYNILRSINKKIFLIHISTDEVLAMLLINLLMKQQNIIQDHLILHLKPQLII
jgi:dTDP-glucose 4,6-dehydratase